MKTIKLIIIYSLFCLNIHAQRSDMYPRTQKAKISLCCDDRTEWLSTIEFFNIDTLMRSCSYVNSEEWFIDGGAYTPSGKSILVFDPNQIINVIGDYRVVKQYYSWSDLRANYAVTLDSTYMTYVMNGNGYVQWVDTIGGVGSEIVITAHEASRTTTELISAINTKYNIPSGSTSDYIRGNGSVASMPAIPSNTNQLTNGAGFLSATDTDKSNWNSAFSWGNHATMGYLSNLSTQTTDNLTEGSTNKYFTDPRVRAAVWMPGSLGTASQLFRVNSGGTALEFFTPNYLMSNQTITLAGSITGSGTTSITTSLNISYPSAGNAIVSGTAFQPNSEAPCFIAVNSALSGVLGLNGTITVAMCNTQNGTYTTVIPDAIAITVLGVGTKSTGTIPIPKAAWVKVTYTNGITGVYTKWDL